LVTGADFADESPPDLPLPLLSPVGLAEPLSEDFTVEPSLPPWTLLSALPVVLALPFALAELDVFTPVSLEPDPDTPPPVLVSPLAWLPPPLLDFAWVPLPVPPPPLPFPPLPSPPPPMCWSSFVVGLS
jgi:hypothetical protein